MQDYQVKSISVLSLSFVLCILLSSCTGGRKMESSKSKMDYRDSNALLFMVFKISNDSVQDKRVIELISKTQSAGKIKNTELLTADFEDYLTIDILGQKKPITTMIIEHPLYKNIEYVDDQGKLATKHVELKQAEFFIRFPMTGNPTKIRISETLKGHPIRELKLFLL